MSQEWWEKENRNEKVGLEVHLGASIFPLIDICGENEGERDGYDIRAEMFALSLEWFVAGALDAFFFATADAKRVHFRADS